MASIVAVTLYRALLRTARSMPKDRAVMLCRPLELHDHARWQHLHTDLWDGYAKNVLPPYVDQYKPADPLLRRDDLIKLVKQSRVAATSVSATVENPLNQGFAGLRLLGRLLELQKRCSVAETDGLRITALSQHMPGQSMGTNNIFYYKMRIDNRGDHTVQLLARHLVFSSATAAGEPLEVMMQVPKWRDGVVGEQPILRPGEAFEYCSSAPSWAPHSVMSGSYQFEILEGPGGVEGELFEAEIAPLRLIMDQPTT